MAFSAVGVAVANSSRTFQRGASPQLKSYLVKWQYSAPSLLIDALTDSADCNLPAMVKAIWT